VESSKNDSSPDRRRRQVAAGCVDEDVDAAPALERGVAGRPQLSFVEHVGNERVGVRSVTAKLRRERFGALLRPREDRDGCAGLGKRSRDRPAEHSGRSRDDRDASRERHS
jgi:hypothetical protein